MKKFYFLFLLLSFFNVYAQQTVTISQIQGEGKISPLEGQKITTTGIVTAVFKDTHQLGGFFIQTQNQDNNPNTSEGIFVHTKKGNVQKGDEVQITGKVSEYHGRTQLNSVSKVQIISQNNQIPTKEIIYTPENWDWEKYEGMLVEFDQVLFVNNNHNLKRYGQLDLGVKRKVIPTNNATPLSTEYDEIIQENKLKPLILDDGYKQSYHTPIVFADENGIRRTGERVKNLKAIIDYTGSKYILYPADNKVIFYGNPRPTKHNPIGNYNLKVCGFNLEYYLTKYLGRGFGAENEEEAKKQHTKIVEALKTIDADIYGLIELERGQTALGRLTDALNQSVGKTKYAFINDGGHISGTRIKVGYLYDTEKVMPYKDLKDNSNVTNNYRKKLQAFTLKENNERFLFSLNHFKSKHCGGAKNDNKDQDDGQSCYNAKRVLEAKSTVNFINSHTSYYDDNDVLIMGDLNAYGKEDPIQYFTNNGYTDMVAQFQPDTAYSYLYHDQVGYLDHVLASPTLTPQITGVTIFHINADESPIFGYAGSEYAPNMYRCSDHDPVIVGLQLKKDMNTSNPAFESTINIYPTIISTKFTVEKAQNSNIEIYSINGILMYKGTIKSDRANFYTNNLGLKNGSYIIKVTSQNRVFRKIIIINSAKNL